MKAIGNSKEQEKGNSQEKGERIKAKGKKNLFPFSFNLCPDFRLSPGFTLLEVMIAMAIVGIALVALLGLGNRSIDVNGRLQKITQATLLAQHKMTEVETVPLAADRELQEEEGSFDPPFEQYRWRVEYEEMPLLTEVHMVTVTVAWGDEARNEAVDLSSFLRRRSP
jgi:general secretion pathway protein I